MDFTLNSVRNLTKEIEREKERLGNLRDGVERITRGYEESVGGKRYRSKIDELVTLIVEAEARLRDLYDARLVARINLLAVMRQAGLKATEERVLELRYVHCQPFRGIAEEMNYAESSILRLHRQAKEKLVARFDEIVAALRKD